MSAEVGHDVAGPRRKSMFLSPTALAQLREAAQRRRTEREAVEEALALLARRDAQRDAMAAFLAWADAEWGPPTEAEQAAADATFNAAMAALNQNASGSS